MSKSQLEAFLEPKRRNSEIRLEELRAQQLQRTPFLVPGVVVNLSQRQLSRVEEHALSYGLQMSWPHYVDNQVVRVETEAMYSKLRRREKVVQEAKMIVRALMRRTMRSWSLTYYKNIKKELDVLSKLAACENLHFCRIGPQIVVMNCTDYSAKMHSWLMYHPYVFRHLGPALQSDKKCALIEQEEQLNAQLEDMRFEKIITRAQFYRFRCRGELPPRLVGRPEMTSNPSDPPLQPLILFEDSCMAKLADWLASELHQVLPREFHVSDAADLCNRLEDVHWEQIFSSSNRPIATLLHGIDPKLSVPLNATQRHIHQLIGANPDLGLDCATLERLTRLCCEKILCLFEGDVYRLEDECVPFDSPLADLLVSLAYDFVDVKWRKTTMQSRPFFFLRCGASALAMFKSTKHALSFLTFCNRVHPRLQQEMQLARNECVSFLDLLIDFSSLPKQPLRTVWPAGRSKNATALRTPSVSFQPHDEKLKAMHECFGQSMRLTSVDQDRKEAIHHLQSVFRMNGYLVRDIERAVTLRPPGATRTRASSDERAVVHWRLPFMPTIYPSIVRGVADINQFLKRSRIVLQLLFHRTSDVLPAEEHVPDLLMGQVVFSLRCSECGHTSIHDSDRHLWAAVNSRQKRHRCEDGADEGPNGGEGEAQSQLKLLPTVLLRTPHHKIAKAVMEGEAGKERPKKTNHVRLHFKRGERKKVRA